MTNSSFKMQSKVNERKLLPCNGLSKNRMPKNMLKTFYVFLALRSELDTPRMTLQSLASTLAVRCRNYRGELSLLSTSRGGGGSSGPPGTQNNYIPTDSLSSASHLLDSSKILIRWLTRFPFLGNSEYDVVTVKLTKHCFELGELDVIAKFENGQDGEMLNQNFVSAMLSQRDSFADNAIEVMN